MSKYTLEDLERVMKEHNIVVRRIPERVRNVYDPRHKDSFPDYKIEYLPEFKREMLVGYTKVESGGKYVVAICKSSLASARFDIDPIFSSLDEVIEYFDTGKDV